MGFVFQNWVLSLSILLLVLCTPFSHASHKIKSKIKTAVFLSPKFELGPGSAVNQYYQDIEFPSGHIALKGFNAEVVDEAGNPVPLHETYLHHWLVGRFNQNKLNKTDRTFVRNSGICQGFQTGQLFGLGSETRGTPTDIPDPFGIEVGNPPEGYEESWMLNVHAIDTRGAEDRLGCTECKCDLYNVTKDRFGQPLKPGYIGGLHCCYDGTQCRVREGFKGPKRSLYMRYIVKWIDWNDFVVPLKVYILDVTDALEMPDSANGITSPRHNCMDEYVVEPCKKGGSCLDVKRQSLPMPNGGYVIYAVAHQHAPGVGSTLYGQDGRVLCSSKPRYGKGKEAGNEKGYIVGMSPCYPRPGSVKIHSGEFLTLESNYTSSSRIHHTGVMGQFFLMVAEHLPHRSHKNPSLPHPHPHRNHERSSPTHFL